MFVTKHSFIEVPEHLNEWGLMALKDTRNQTLATTRVGYLAVYFEIKIRINQRLHRSMKFKRDLAKLNLVFCTCVM